MSATQFSRRKFFLGQYGDSKFSSQNDTGILSLRFSPVPGSKWSVFRKDLRVEKVDQQSVCYKHVTDIEYLCSRMMDGSKSLEDIITEMLHLLHQDKRIIQQETLEFIYWALENNIIQVVSTHE